MKHPKEIEEAPRIQNWKRVYLEGAIHGLEVNPDGGWTGHKNIYTYDPKEYDGILFEGKGPEKTMIVPRKGSNSTINIGSGRVRFENLGMESSTWTMILTSRYGGPQVFLEMQGVHGIIRNPFPDGGRTKWGLSLHSTDDIVEDCEFWGEHAQEHLRYGRGYGS